MTDGIEGIPWETLMKLFLAAGVLLLFVYLGVKLMDQTRPDTDFASTTSYIRVFLTNVDNVYTTNLSKSTFLNLGLQREIIYYKSNEFQKPKCNKGDNCVCLYNVNADKSQGDLIECNQIKANITMKYKGDLNAYFDINCFATYMSVCKNDQFPQDLSRTLYLITMSRTPYGVELKFD
jgi:hypothetical protein